MVKGNYVTYPSYRRSLCVIKKSNTAKTATETLMTTRKFFLMFPLFSGIFLTFFFMVASLSGSTNTHQSVSKKTYENEFFMAFWLAEC
jgi:hypothetical protein